MHDLIVIGGGFWGTMTAYLARAAHRDVLLLDDLNPYGASRNAAGIVSLGWYRNRSKKDRQNIVANIFFDTFQPSDALEGIDFLRDLGALRQTGEEFFSYRGKQTFRPDLFLLSSPQALFEQTDRTWGSAERVFSERGCWFVQTPERILGAKGIVIAAGAFTDSLLQASGFKPLGVEGLRGRGILIRPHRHFEVPLTIESAPYHHVTLRPWQNGMARVGDTVEKKPGGDDKLKPLQRIAETLAPGYEQVRVMDGLRPVLPKVFVGEVAPGLAVATGGHRVGLALAPAAARKALALLGVK